MERYQPDLDAYMERVRSGPCFVCAVVSRDQEFLDHHVVYEDATAIAFLNRYPTQYGYTLVAPKEHRGQVTGDFTLREYIGLQRVVHRTAEAVREEVGAERVYLLSLGSNQGNAPVHWHVVPLLPGTPYEEQQFAAVITESAGVLEITEDENAALATRIGRRLEESQETDFGG